MRIIYFVSVSEVVELVSFFFSSYDYDSSFLDNPNRREIAIPNTYISNISGGPKNYAFAYNLVNKNRMAMD